ncbi:MAG: TrbI F-type domain-containing protein [Alphaproteobacteria bacterium]|nr:TrbI F-type domain-containing protein [Alphaproteobacteria bacterium]
MADMGGNGSPGSLSGAGSWPVVVSAVLLSGAVAAAVAAATVRLAVPEAPRFGSVRLAEITAAYTTRAVSEVRTAGDVRAWGAALEAALDGVARRHDVVLLPARAVAAGAPDLTPEVEAALAAILARAATGTAPPPGDGR